MHLEFILLFVNILHFNLCDKVDFEDDVVFQAGFQPQLNVGVAKNERYLLYDVNPGEGFNLRRDVYMRVANLVAKLIAIQDEWVLVLPPWGRIYHWQSEDVQPQIRLPWNLFFDVNSLNLYVPVIEFDEYLKRIGKPEIEQIYLLQHYAEGWTDGNWEEKMDVRPCIDKHSYRKDSKTKIRGWFWGYENVYAKNLTCLSVQGHASTLLPIFTNSSDRSIFVDRAEVVLHDVYGDSSFWKVRRSMRFAHHLREIGDQFRRDYLDSTDEKDKTVLDSDWRKTQKKHGSAVGGPYLAVHLRRADFLYGHKSDVPSLKFAVKQLKAKMEKFNLTKVFVATDAYQNEIEELKSYLPNMLRYIPSSDVKKKYKDGGVAIIDQWICAHAKYFIGTHESTFSFRIQEEREILGFDPQYTFNILCPDKKKTCEKPSKWTIVY